jgi:hypothetical protein
VIDGRDISPLLFGQTKESQREAHYYFSSYNLQAVRQGPWKLAIASQKETMGKEATGDANTNPRLYNLDAEIGERTNLADKHPDIVAKLTALAEKMSAEIGGDEPKARRPAGEVESPVTMYPTEDDGRGKKKAEPKKGGKAKPVSLDALQPGDTLESDAAPQIAKKPFTITCDVATKQPDGIILAHGGASVGYALHLSGGKLFWVVRLGKEETHAATSFTSDGKPQHIVASLAKDGAMTLKVNDHPPATAKAPGLILGQPKEDFCLGHDNKVQVTTYTAKGKFVGVIAGLRIHVD